MKRLFTALAIMTVTLILTGNEVWGQTRIRFAKGRTSASVTSTINGSAQRKYILGARAGQTLSANVSSRNGCVVLGNEQTSESYATDSGDNWIDLFNRCKSTTSFTLTVSIY